MKAHDGRRVWLLAPVFGPGCEEPADAAAEVAARADSWRKAGYLRLMVDGREARLDGGPIEVAPEARVDLVIDRLQLEGSVAARVAEAVEEAESLSAGRVSLQEKGGARSEYSTSGTCPECGFRLTEEMEPRHFSFNTHVGACEVCEPVQKVQQPDQPRSLQMQQVPSDLHLLSRLNAARTCKPDLTAAPPFSLGSHESAVLSCCASGNESRRTPRHQERERLQTY